ncbi:MAG: glycosyltransferase family 4 protein [Candidatus Pelethousia sp.]|nr:glycosyltransferase family 4 protein [Candidatus Pelethousia sp.]
MRILHVLAQLPYGTGSGIYFTNIIKELAQCGHEQCAVFALQDGGLFEQLPAERQYPVFFKTEKLPFPVPGMSDVMPYDSIKYSDMTAEMLALWMEAFRKALARAADFEPDVLILHHLWMLTSLAVTMFPKKRCIGICHYTDLRQARQNPQLLERHVTEIDRLDTILTLCDTHHGEIRRLYHCDKTSLLTMGGGYDGTLFYPAENKRKEGPVRILYAGKIDPSKGIFVLIQAFLALQKQDDGLRLSIVGAPTQRYAAQIGDLLAGNASIRQFPPMPQKHLADAMREHDIFVLPSFYEGLGLIAVEALACGLWTVSTEIEGLVSLLGKSAVCSGAIELVPLAKPEDLATPDSLQVQAFIESLAAKIALQIGRVRGGKGFPASAVTDIVEYSWKEIVKRLHAVLIDESMEYKKSSHA